MSEADSHTSDESHSNDSGIVAMEAVEDHNEGLGFEAESGSNSKALGSKPEESANDQQISATSPEIITLEDSDDEADQTQTASHEGSMPALNIKQEQLETNTEKGEVQQPLQEKNNMTTADDSFAQFGQTIVKHLREANLSKGAMLMLQGKLLATIAEHIP